MDSMSNSPELLITCRMGKFAQDISSAKVRCPRELLEIVFEITAPISCDFVFYEPPSDVLCLPMRLANGKWRGMREKTAEGLKKCGYPEYPIKTLLDMQNKGIAQEDDRLENLFKDSESVSIPVTIVHGVQEHKVLLVAERIHIKLVDDHPGSMFYLVMINPIHVMTRPDQDKRQGRIYPVASLVNEWLARQTKFREYCYRMLRGEEIAESPAISFFRNLICIHTLEDLIEFAEAGMVLHHDFDNEEKFIQWLENEIIRFVGLPRVTGEGWHSCLQDPWPPCHEGRLADRELAKILLYFCPWTSSAISECAAIPQGLNSQWREIVHDRLWGWTPLHRPNHYVDNQGVNPRSLNEKSLTRVFAAEFLDADSRFSYLNGYITSKERGCYLTYVGRVLHYLLAGTQLNWRTIEGLVWMIAEYGHRYLGIDPRLDIASHLLQAARAEPALHSMQAYYRDHFFHAIEVCFLGHLLLVTKDHSGKYLWQHVAKNLRAARRAGKGSKRTGTDPNDGLTTLKDVLRLWYVTALFHDVGYTIQIFSALQNMLKFYCHPDEMKIFQSDLEHAIKKLSDSISESELGSILKLKKDDNPGEDHGVIAATHLKSLLFRLGDDKDPGNYDPAIRAIGFHNNRRAIVNFQTDPLGFLLILCDTIQEWNRPHLRYTMAPSMLLARLLGKEGKFEDTTSPLDTVSMFVTRFSKPKPRPKLQIEDGGTLKIDLTYNKEIQTNSGVFNLWIDSSCNLQRICLDSLPFDIQITFRTPWFQLPGHNAQSQMSRLRDAAADTHMRFLRDWLPSSMVGPHEASNATGAVRHLSDDETGYDKLILDLRLLSKEKTIAGNIIQFREHLQYWKYYNEDRDFEGNYTPIVPGK